MDTENISQALMIGVSTFIGVMVLSAILFFYNTSLQSVKNAGSGMDFDRVYRNDIESTLLLNGSNNSTKGSNIINLINYYQNNVDVTISIQNIKYIDGNGNIQIMPSIDIESNDLDVRKSSFDSASRYIMDNQDFTINVDVLDEERGTKIITIKGV